MLLLLFWIVVLAVNLLVLAKASDCFVDAATTLGSFMGMPHSMIGVLIVSIGTSIPELIVSLISVLSGSSEIVVGNVVGSNISNILLIFGLFAIIGKKLLISYENVHIHFLIGATFLLLVAAWDGTFTFSEAFLFILAGIVYLRFSLRTERRAEERRSIEGIEPQAFPSKFNRIKLAVLLSAPIAIYVGAHYTVESLVALSEILNVETSLIAETAVALSTSLPELSATFAATRKGSMEVALGNIMGSNVFNVFFVMGISGLLGTLIIPQNFIAFDLPMLLIATLLYFFITRDKDISSSEGWLLFIFYVFFLGKILGFL